MESTWETDRSTARPSHHSLPPPLTALALAASQDHRICTTNSRRRIPLLAYSFQAGRRAGIEGAEPGGSVDLHSLRVTFCTLAFENGASPKAIQSILGHSTLALTMNLYARATVKSKREAISCLPKLGVVTEDGQRRSAEVA